MVRLTAEKRKTTCLTVVIGIGLRLGPIPAEKARRPVGLEKEDWVLNAGT